MDNHAERREFYRHPVHLPIKVSDKEDTTPVSFEAQNLSLGGACILTPVSIPLGRKVHVQIPLPERLGSMKARIAYCQEDESGYYRIGLEFLDHSNKIRASLSRLFFDIYEFHRSQQAQNTDLNEETAANLWLSQNLPRFAA